MARFQRLLLALFLCALTIRLFGLRWDSGHWFHPDERRIAEAVQEIHLQPLQLDPRFFAYGSLPFYLTRAVQGAVGAVRPSLLDYSGAILTGRALSALLGALTVLLLGLLGRRLHGEKVGLLAAALLAVAVLHLQNSHFATSDVPLTFFVLLALTFLVRAADTGALRDFLPAGLAIGLAAATKVSALPLFLPLLVAALFAPRGSGKTPWARVFGMAAGCAVLGFALGEPYALLDFKAFAHDVAEQSRMVRTAGIVPYTTQYVGTPKVLYELREILLWGLGPLLGLAGFWGAYRTFRWKARRVEPGEWVFLSFAVPFFLITASFEVKFPRYLLPLYPLVCLWAARWLCDEVSVPRRRLKRVARRVVLGGTALYALAFLAIYTRPHTIVTASRWLYANVPRGSALLTQDWDEGFPFDLDGRSAGEYRITGFPFYDADDDAKIRRLATSLAKSDLVVFQTKRLYGALTRAPERYPKSDRFFRLLFAGDLGFDLKREFASRPGFFGHGLFDELADESFTVYDHPKVLVFENRSRLSAEDLEDRILSGAPSRLLTRRQILLAPHGVFVNVETPGEFHRSSIGALLLLVLFAEALGLAGYELLRRFVSSRPGLYALGKVTGILVFAFLAWWVVSLGLLPFTRPVLVLVALVLLAASAATSFRRIPGTLPLRELLLTEGVVWGSFLFFVLVRAGNPEIFWGEKPMDFSFLNTLYRAVSLPPAEPWFAGTALDYTYFGHFTFAALGKLLAIQPALMFNLAVALCAALAAAGLFSAGALLGGGPRTGAAAVALGLFAGNFSGIKEVLARHAVNFDAFWATTRVVPDTINEFPFWSFIFADLHAHVLALPAVLGLVSVLILGCRETIGGQAAGPASPLAPAAPLTALGALFLGAAATTNGWGTPTWLSLAALLLLVASTRSAALLPPARRLVGVGSAAAAFLAGVLGAYLLFRPFWKSFTVPARTFGWERGPFARPWDVFDHFGLFFLILVPFVFLAVWRTLADAGERPWVRPATTGVLCLLSLASLLQWRGATPHAADSIRNFAAVFAFLGLYAAFHPKTEARHRIPAALAGLAFAIVAGCEVVYVWDRMNTIFKFCFDAWLLFSIAGALVLGDLAVGFLGSPGGLGALGGRWWRLAWRSAVAIGFAAACVTSGVALLGLLRTNRVGGPRGTLDGTAYLATFAPDEAALYRWLGKSVPGLPTIAEAWGPSYQEFGRVSMNSGLPTVLGWDYHLFQRGKPWSEIDRRKADLKALYTTRDAATASAILRRYQIRYLVVGALERDAYALSGPSAFDSFQGLLNPVFRKGSLTVYAVVRDWRPPASP